MQEVNPHAQACCLVHGCRYYSDKLCPVKQGVLAQITKCGETAICKEYRDWVLSEDNEDPYEH